MHNGSKRVSYCTTCHGRLWQVALTLFDNLDRLRDDEELILLDYGSPDGLGRFVESSTRCRQAMEQGQLIYGHTEAASYHCPKAKNLAHRLGRGDILINLDADNSNRGMRRVVERCFARLRDAAVLQMDEGTRGDPLRGTFGRIGLSRYWFYRLGGYDESLLPIGHQDGDLVWRAKAMGLEHIHARTGGPPPIRNTMGEKASHTGKKSWHAMWRANEKASRRNLKEGRLVANLDGWGAAEIGVNFNEIQALPAVSPQLVSLVLLSRSALATKWLLDSYDAMPEVGEILLVNRNPSIQIDEIADGRCKVTVINACGDCNPFARLKAAALASFPAVLLTSDDVFLPHETLFGLHKAWFEDAGVLHAVAAGGPSKVREIALAPGVMTSVQTCVAALAYSSRVPPDLAGPPGESAEGVLLSFVAKKANHRENQAYPLTFHELGHPGGKRPEQIAPLLRWCRQNVTTGGPADLVIEVGSSAPAMVSCEPASDASWKESLVFAGPWVGEFGWELCWWNPLLRSLAESVEHVIVAAPESSRYLYEFASEFVPLETEGWRFAEGRLFSKLPRVCNGCKTLSPEALWQEFGLQECRALKSGKPTLTPKKWRLLAPGKPGPFVADVLCAFRPPKIVADQLVEGKDYDQEKSAELVDLLLRAGLSVACYGGKDNYCFDGAIDLRGKPLEAQCSALSAAKCAVGPSSAPLHLASLCNCPHITWSRISGDIAIRYESHWNPFSTPSSFLDMPDPSPSEIAEQVMRLVEALQM